MQMPEISIMVLNYNSGQNLLEVIESIFNSKISVPIEVIIIDNASTDGSLAKAKKKFTKIRVVKMPQNFGTAAYTKAQRDIRGRYIFFTSDDKPLERNCIEKLYQTLIQYGDIAQAAPLVLDNATKDVDIGGTWLAPWFYAGKTMQKPTKRITEVPYFGMGLLNVSALKKAGGYIYDERYFMYGEDVDLGLRLKKAGFKIVLVADAIALHKGDVSTKIWDKKYLQYLSERNSLRTFFKHSSFLHVLLLLLPVLAARSVKIIFDIARLRLGIASARTKGAAEAIGEWVQGKSQG